MGFTVADLKYLEPEMLRSWMSHGKSASGPGKYAVVDVRDGDHVGGHIMNSKHYPSGNLSLNMPKLVEEICQGGYNDVVFHCALSQQRGPSLLMKFQRYFDNEPTELLRLPKEFQVWILRGGFTKWQELYGEDKTVTEGYMKDIWLF